MSLTVAGGGGSGRDVSGCCGGGSARVSVGVGHDQEVGLETGVVGGDPDAHALYVLTKLRYKLGLGRHLALLAGVGATGTLNTKSGDGTAGVGGDLGLVASTGLLGRALRLYGGARFSFVFGAKSDLYDGVPTQAFVVPAGLSFELNPSWRFFVEGGLLGGFSEFRSEGKIALGKWLGGYGLFALSYIWNS